MNHVNCVVVGCSNTYDNTRNRLKTVSFYRIPAVSRDRQRRQDWITFVARKNLDGTNWQPTNNSRICSDHFIDNVKSNFPLSASYIPTIRPSKVMSSASRSVSQKATSTNSRADRAFARNLKMEEKYLQALKTMSTKEQIEEVPPTRNQFTQCTSDPRHKDNTGRIIKFWISFSCNFGAVITHDATTQVEHEPDFDQVKLSNASVGTGNKTVCFYGFESVNNRLHDLTSVDPRVFNLLLDLLHDLNSKRLHTEDHLLLFLLKLKHGLTFTALSVIFGISRYCATINFYKILDILFIRTQELLFWPTREEINETMPLCFQETYPECRCIIDCSEVRTQKPGGLQKQNSLYSYYKSSHTLKFLIAIAPDGLITYISEAYGGRSSDVHITNHSGFLNLLSPGDLVMADKGFPTIKTNGIITIIPPRAKPGQKQFSVEDMEKTKKIASVRIHVERVIQRLKIFKLLSNTLDLRMVPHIRKILHVCAVLVNMQPPIIQPSEAEVEELDQLTDVELEGSDEW